MTKPKIVCVIGSGILTPVILILATAACVALIELLDHFGLWPNFHCHSPAWLKWPWLLVCIATQLLCLWRVYRWLFKHCHEGK